MPSFAKTPVPQGPELLSPAGDWDSLKAAVANGADAVYFGLRRFSARGRATNFAPDELPAVFEYLRDHNTRGYVAFNTLIFPGELAEAARYVEAIAGAGADAVIVQDIGLLRLIRRMAPTLSVHASTQMTQTHAEGLHLLEDWGVRRVILARELSLAQIRGLRAECGIELEVFVHGALCISFSGQCLASQTLFGRSGNRGLCGQACRLPYELVTGEAAPQEPSPHEPAPQGPAPEAQAPSYLLSPRDLCARDLIGELVEIGVAGVKIEGRLKSADYVAAATRAYREAIDAALGGRPAPRGDLHELRMAQSFSRGFTQGYLGGAGPQELVDGQSPKNRGRRVGTVAGLGRSGILVEQLLGEEIRPGDGVLFGGGAPEAGEQGGRVYTVRREFERGPRRPGAGRTVEIAFGTGAVELSAVAPGSDVWKSDDPAVRRDLRQSYSRDVLWRRRKLDLEISAEVGGALRIRGQDDHGLAAEVEWPGPLEASERHPLTEASIREQFSRLGNTPFELGGVSLRGATAGPAVANEAAAEKGPAAGAEGNAASMERGVDAGAEGRGTAAAIPVLAPKSVLNGLRRELVEKLRQLRVEAARHEIVSVDLLVTAEANHEAGALQCSQRSGQERQEDAPQAPAQGRAVEKKTTPALCVLVRSLGQLDAVIQFHTRGSPGAVALVYCDLGEEGPGREALARARSAGLPAAATTTVVLMPGEETRLRGLLDSRPDAVLVRNLAALRWLRREAPGLPLIADYSLNLANEVAAGAILEAGAARVTACMDLEKEALLAMAERVPGSSLEVVASLHVPMFHTAHCLWADRPGRSHRPRLRDRIGEEHPVRVDEAGRTTVFRSWERSLLSMCKPLVRAGVGSFRIELLEDSPEEATRLLEQWTRRLRGE